MITNCYIICLLATVFLVMGLEKEQHFKVHLEEERHLLKGNLTKAVDVKLIHHGNMDEHHIKHICSVQQRGLEMETQDMRLIKDKDLDRLTLSNIVSKYFDPDQPLNLKQFVSMAHINDGILAVDSSMEVFMLKFNYNGVHASQDSKSDISEDDEQIQPAFATLKWRADIGSVTLSEKAKQEIPQLVYSIKWNVALLVYTESAQLFSVQEMETNNQKLRVTVVNTWKSRVERGWSKAYNDLLYSAVGQAGIDLYLINDKDVSFVETLTLARLYGGHEISQPDKPLYIEDFEVIPCDEDQDQNCHRLYLLDQHRGIMIVEINHKGDDVKINMIADEIGYLKGGIAMDTYNGETVITAYLQGDRYITEEIRVNLEDASWMSVAKYEQYKKIRDVKINEDIGIIQGINHYQVIFHGTAPGVRVYELAEPIYIPSGGMRDFEFFNINQLKKTQSLFDVKLKAMGYKFDDFLFGISKHHLLVSRYRVETPVVKCFAEAKSLTQEKFLYTVVYNTSSCGQNQLLDPKHCKKEVNFSVEVVQTLLFKDQLIILIVVVALIILVFLALLLVCLMVLMYRRYKHDSQSLETQIQQIHEQKRGRGNMSLDQLQGDKSIDIAPR